MVKDYTLKAFSYAFFQFCILAFFSSLGIFFIHLTDGEFRDITTWVYLSKSFFLITSKLIAFFFFRKQIFLDLRREIEFDYPVYVFSLLLSFIAFSFFELNIDISSDSFIYFLCTFIDLLVFSYFFRKNQSWIFLGFLSFLYILPYLIFWKLSFLIFCCYLLMTSIFLYLGKSLKLGDLIFLSFGFSLFLNSILLKLHSYEILFKFILFESLVLLSLYITKKLFLNRL